MLAYATTALLFLVAGLIKRWVRYEGSQDSYRSFPAARVSEHEGDYHRAKM